MRQEQGKLHAHNLILFWCLCVHRELMSTSTCLNQYWSPVCPHRAIVNLPQPVWYWSNVCPLKLLSTGSTQCDVHPVCILIELLLTCVNQCVSSYSYCQLAQPVWCSSSVYPNRAIVNLRQPVCVLIQLLSTGSTQCDIDPVCVPIELLSTKYYTDSVCVPIELSSAPVWC